MHSKIKNDDAIIITNIYFLSESKFSNFWLNFSQQTEDEKDLEYAFFGIYDGHGGKEASQYAKVKRLAVQGYL